MFQINTDASIDVNPGGTIAWVYVVCRDGVEVYRNGGVIPACAENTNNKGEYLGVLGALYWLMKLPEDKRGAVRLCSDSRLVVNQLLGVWDCHFPVLAGYRDMILEAVKFYGQPVTFQWVPREENTVADLYSKQVARDGKDVAVCPEIKGDLLSW